MITPSWRLEVLFLALQRPAGVVLPLKKKKKKLLLQDVE